MLNFMENGRDVFFEHVYLNSIKYLSFEIPFTVPGNRLSR